MMNMTKLISSMVALIVISIVVGFFIFRDFETNSNYQLKVLHTDKGWAYEISKRGKPYIYQDIIPGLAGNNYFADSLMAYKMGRYVTDKLEQNMTPTVSYNELMEMGIIKQ